RRIELLRMRIGGNALDPLRCFDDPLAETGRGPLVSLALVPRRGSDGPWAVGSELIFLGWSGACGIAGRDASVDKAHCALLRTASAAYVVDLCGKPTRIGDSLLEGAALLEDGVPLAIGATPFTVRVGPAAVRGLPAPLAEPPPLVARIINPEIVASG